MQMLNVITVAIGSLSIAGALLCLVVWRERQKLALIERGAAARAYGEP
jgi:hypothetical protein